MNVKLLTVTAFLVFFHPTLSWAGECMATINDPDGYTNVREFKGGKVIATVTTGERFIAAAPYQVSKEQEWWRVYLKSGVTGLMDRSRIRLLPDEPLMKLNYNTSKKAWEKLQSEPVTENTEASWQAKKRGIDYYKTLVQASGGDFKALARFFSLSANMDGAAVETYRPEAWELFHIVGDETFAQFLATQSSELRENVRELFSDWEITTDPISKPKPYIKRHFPKTYKLLFAQ